MKRKNRNQTRGETGDKAQLILIGGLVIAVAVIAIALVVGGGLFSQSTNDDGGLSSFTSQTAEQVQVAKNVGQTNLNYSNINATLLQGAYPEEICDELVSSTQVRQLVSAQLGQGESIVDIEVTSQDCEGDNNLEDASWTVGQTNPDYELPSVNSTSAGGGTQTVTCKDLNEDTNFDDGNVQNEWIDQIVANNGGTVPKPVDVDGADKLDALEDIEDSTALTLEPIRAFEGLDSLEYAKTCTSYDVKEGRENVDVVLSIDTTGSMGLDGFDDSVSIDEDYNDNYDPSFSPSKVNTPRVQVHKETYTTDSGRTYTRPDPFDISCYKEYSETATEFPRGGDYGDTDESNRDWCEGTDVEDDMNRVTFDTSVGEVGDYVWYDGGGFGGGEIVKVVDIPDSSPPGGIPEDWTRLTDDDVPNTNDPSEYCTTNGGSTANCVTRNTDFSPGGPAGVGEVVEWTNYDITVDVTSYIGSFGGNEYYEVEFFGSTYATTEDELEYFEYKWAGPDVTVEEEDGSTSTVEADELDYVEYRWWTPDRLFLTQAGARTAIDDLLDASEPGERDSVGLVEYTTELSGDASTVRGLNELDSGYGDTLKKDIDELRPGSGTNIKAGIEEGVEVLEGSDPNKTDHIILMTDGQNTPGEPDPVDYVEDNSDIEGSLDSGITIHAIALGEGADKSTMRELGNDYDNPPSGGIDSDRPNGTFIASEDPSDAEGIFEDIVSEIQASAEGNDDANAGVDNPDASFSTSPTANTGTVQDIQDTRMNVTDFQGNGTYRMSFEGDVDNDGDDELIWRVVVDNKFTDLSPYGYEVEFVGGPDEPSSLDQTVTVPDTEGNLSDTDDHVWIDLTGRDPAKPRFDVGASVSSPDSYVSNGWKEVEKELGTGPTDGVNIIVEHIGPNGPNNPPRRRGTVRGTFSMEFEPKKGNFSKIGQMTGGNFTDDCNTANATDLPSRCGLNDSGNDRGAVGTVQINKLVLRVTVESPEGRSERRITIPPGNKEFDLDIFDPPSK